MNISNKKFLFPILLFLSGISFLSENFTEQIFRIYEAFFQQGLSREFRQISFNKLGVQLILLSCTLSAWQLFRFNRAGLMTAYAALFIFYYYHIITDSLNIPVFDDYVSYLAFMNGFVSASGFKNKLHELCGFYYESRIIVSRALVALDYFIFGKVNFQRLLLIVTMLGIPAVCAILYRSFRIKDNKPLFFLPPLLLFLQFQYYDTLFMLTPAMNFIGMLLFASACIYFIVNHQVRGSIFLSLLFLLLSVCNYGNGFVLIPVVIFMLFLKKKWKEMLLFLFVSLLVSGLYFYHSDFSSRTVFSFNILYLIQYFFIFLGSSMQFFYSPPVMFITGLTVFSFFIRLSYKRYYSQNLFIYSLLLFIFLSALTAAIFRSGLQEGSLMGMFGHYGILSITAIMCCVMAAFEVWGGIYFRAVLFTSLLYNLSSNFFFYPEVVKRKLEVTETFNSYRNSKKEFIDPVYIREGSAQILREAEEKGFYSP